MSAEELVQELEEEMQELIIDKTAHLNELDGLHVGRDALDSLMAGIEMRLFELEEDD